MKCFQGSNRGRVMQMCPNFASLDRLNGNVIDGSREPVATWVGASEKLDSGQVVSHLVGGTQ